MKKGGLIFWRTSLDLGFSSMDESAAAASRRAEVASEGGGTSVMHVLFKEEKSMKQMILISAVCTLLTGCFNVTTHLAPTNPQVPVKLVGTDCRSIMFGVCVGTSTVDAALMNGRQANLRYGNYDVSKTAIKSIHSIALQDMYFLGFGQRCVVVEGAP